MIDAATPRSVQAARNVSRGAFILLGASIPISIAIDNVLLGIIFASWLIAGHFRDTLRIVQANPVALCACVWFVLHVVGATCNSIADTSDTARALRKALPLMIIPIAATVMQDPLDRDRALYAFMAAIALTSVLACLRWTGLIPAEAKWLQPANYGLSVVFKKSLTQNLLLAFGAFVFALYAFRCQPGWLRTLLGGCAALIAAQVLFLGEGRTGQVTLLALIVYLGWWAKGRSGLLVAVAVAVVLAAGAYALPESTLHKRSTLALKEAEEWQRGAAGSNSTAHRLQFYTTTWEMIGRQPFIGAGTGSFPEAYRRHVSETNIPPTRNPHSEYLLKTAELGLVGLMLMLALICICWRSARSLPDRTTVAAARGVTLWLGLASLVSSTLSDHTEGLFFAWAASILYARLPPKAA